jgi:hypothetical protein
MTDDDTKCPDCGGLYALMGGRIHRCSMALRDAIAQVPASPRKRAKAAAFDREAYHRAYMREYMRKRRATGKA